MSDLEMETKLMRRPGLKKANGRNNHLTQSHTNDVLRLSPLPALTARHTRQALDMNSISDFCGAVRVQNSPSYTAFVSRNMNNSSQVELGRTSQISSEVYIF